MVHSSTHLYLPDTYECYMRRFIVVCISQQVHAIVVCISQQVHAIVVCISQQVHAIVVCISQQVHAIVVCISQKVHAIVVCISQQVHAIVVCISQQVHAIVVCISQKVHAIVVCISQQVHANCICFTVQVHVYTHAGSHTYIHTYTISLYTHTTEGEVGDGSDLFLQREQCCSDDLPSHWGHNPHSSVTAACQNTQRYLEESTQSIHSHA